MREARELERNRMRSENPRCVEPFDLLRECPTSSCNRAHQFSHRSDARVVRKRNESDPFRKRVRCPPGSRVETTEDDKLVEALRKRADEEDEGAICRHAGVVGAVGEICIDSESHVRRSIA